MAVERYNRPKMARNKYGYVPNGGSSFSGGSSSSNQTNGSLNLDKHTFWGQPYDGTQDVDGDMLVNGSITVNGNVDATNMSAEEITTDVIKPLNDNDLELQGTVLVSEINKEDGSLTINGEVNIDKLNTNEIKNNGNIETLNLTAYSSITTDYLTVNKSAHFFELIIDKVKSVGGQLIITDANFKVDDVQKWIIQDVKDRLGNAFVNLPEEYGDTTGFRVKCARLWQKATDGDLTIQNQFQADDMVVCQTFNVANGVNKYYWTVVANAGAMNHIFPNEEEAIPALYIDVIVTLITTTDQVAFGDGDVNPEIGDELVQLGNTYSIDRQSAIIINAYNSSYLDNVEAPCIVQYQGINTFIKKNGNDTALQPFRVTKISPSGNEFIGTFKVLSGGKNTDIIDYINSQLPDDVITYQTYIAYSNSSDGSNYVTAENKGDTDYAYIGLCNSSVAPTDKSQYTWTKVQGDAIIKFVPTATKATVDASRTMTLMVNGYVYQINGATYTPLAVNSFSMYYLLGYDTTVASLNTKMAGTYNATNGLYTFTMTRALSDDNQLIPTIATIKLTKYNTPTSIYDTTVIPVTLQSGAFFEVADDIKARVQNAEGDIADLRLTASGLTSTVSAHTGQISVIEQKADEISLKLENQGGKNILIRSDFNLEDYDKYWYLQPDSTFNPLTNGSDFTYKAVKSTYQSTTFKNYFDFSFNDRDNFTQEYTNRWQYIYSDHYLDLLSQSLRGKLKPNTWYTLSFYIIGEAVSTYIHSSNGVSDPNEKPFVNGVRIDEISNAVWQQSHSYTGSPETIGRYSSTDNEMNWNVYGGTWKRCTYTFKTKRTLTNNENVYLLFRSWMSKSQEFDNEDWPEGTDYPPYIQIAQPKLEEGMVATEWDNGDDGNIDLKATGIDIESHKITLTADNIIAQNNAGEKTFGINENGDVEIGGNASISGFVLPKPLVITSANAFNYLKPYDIYDQSSYYFDFTKCGNVIIIESLPKYGTQDISAVLYLPSIPLNAASLDQSVVMEARRYIGQHIVVINKTGAQIATSGSIKTRNVGSGSYGINPTYTYSSSYQSIGIPIDGVGIFDANYYISKPTSTSSQTREVLDWTGTIGTAR